MAQIEGRIKRYEAIGTLLCKGSKSEKIWKLIDVLGICKLDTIRYQTNTPKQGGGR
jgi:hypothetical protein